MEEEKQKGNELLKLIVDSILEIIDRIMPSISFKSKKCFNFNLFDDDNSFYIKNLSNLSDLNFYKVFSNIKGFSLYFLRNLNIFLKYLQTLIDSNKFEQLYKDPIVKLDISLIIGYLVNNYGSKIIEPIEFFHLSIKELEKKYKIKNTDIQTKYDIELTSKAKEQIKDLKFEKKINYTNMLESLIDIYMNSENYEDLEKIKIIYEQFKKDKACINLDELENKYIITKDFNNHMEVYLQKTLLRYGFNKKKEKEKDELYDKKKAQLKNHLFYSDILKIDLNDIHNSVYLLYFMSSVYKGTPFFDIEEEFKNLLKGRELTLEKDDFTIYLNKIIAEESFQEDLIKILNTSLVKNYFLNARRFSETGYQIEYIAESQIVDGEDDLLKDGYNTLMNWLRNDKNFLRKIVIYKYLPKYRRAFVDPNMRIVINPIYFEFSDSLNENKRDDIFRAYLFIIIIHEIVHLVKFLKGESFPFDNIPKTPKSKEGGKMFINYLFNLPVIYYITAKQAEIINKPENWNDDKLLSNVFKEQQEWYEKNKIDKDYESIRPSCIDNDSISFFLSLFENENNNSKSSRVIVDDYYDID